MKKRLLLGLIVIVAWGGGTYLGYLKQSSYQVYALPLALVGLLMGICLGLLVWGRMEDLSLRNLQLDSFSAIRLVITAALLAAVHFLFQRLGKYGSFLDYWPVMGLIVGANLPGILLRGAYGKGSYKRR